jgi:hypothetical protein
MKLRQGRRGEWSRRIGRLVLGDMQYSPSWQFIKDILRLIWEYKWFSLAIFAVTILQEYSALWPVNLLGQFIDGLTTGDIGNVVWLFFAASLFYPFLVRANVMLRHTMFYETDFQKTVELVFKASAGRHEQTAEEAGTAFTRTANAVSGITNATYHVLGSFTPVVIKIIIVAGSLLSYNRTLGLVYLASLILPGAMTIFFNKWLRVLLDSQYSVASEVSGSGIRTFSEKGNEEVRSRFRSVMALKKRIYLQVVYKGQIYTYLREAALVGSQFLVVFIALAMRNQLHLTPGDFTKIVGYTTQVAAAFINAAVCLDAIISYSRAYHVFAISPDGQPYQEQEEVAVAQPASTPCGMEEIEW